MALRLSEQKYQGLVIDALVALSDIDPDFPHLARLDDGDRKVEEARTALSMVRAATEQYSELASARESVLREAEHANARETARRLHDEKLGELKERFFAMHKSSDDPQRRGLDFEVFLNELFEMWDLNPRAAYSLDHEQIDGAFTFRTDDYILEAKWWAAALGPREVNDFRAKVDGKARNTLGLCISISGFTDGAIAKHSQAQTPLVLMDGNDLVPILEGRIGLDEVLGRKRRHAAETGNAMYRASS